jgi:hypothetical protein
MRRSACGAGDQMPALQLHSGLTFVTAAIVLWNTVYLGRPLDALRRRREVVPNALLAHIAPLGWQHINLTGDYLWDADTAIGPTGFRPLRGVEAPFAQAA